MGREIEERAEEWYGVRNGIGDTAAKQLIRIRMGMMISSNRVVNIE